MRARNETEARNVGAFSLQGLARVLWPKLWFLLGTGFLTGIVFFLGSLLLHNTFRAIAIVMPPDRSSGSISMMSSAAGAASLPTGALAALNMKNPADLYVALMTSPGVEEVVVRRFGLQQLYKKKYASQVLAEFESNLRVASDPKSGLIDIAVTDQDPQRAADMANGLITAFDESSSRLAITDAQRRRLFFDQQVNETKSRLAVSEDALKNSKERSGLVEPEGDARALIGLQAQLTAQIASKRVEVASQKVYLADENPRIQTATTELQGLEGQLASLNQKTGATSSNKGAETEATLDYARKFRDVRFNETLLELLIKNQELAKLDEAREGNVVQVVYAATAPDLKSGPRRSFFLAGGFMIGIIGAMCWVLFGAWMRHPDTMGIKGVEA